MAITRSAAQVESVSGANSQLIIIPLDTYTDEDKNDVSEPLKVAADGTESGGHASDSQPLAVDADIRDSGPNIRTPYKSGSASATPPQPGPLTIVGGLNIAMSALSNEELWAMVTQCRKVEWTYTATGTQTAPAVVTVATISDLTATSVTISNALTATTNPVTALVTVAEELQIGTDENLNGTVSLSNTLSAVTAPTKIRVVVSGGRISAGETEATIEFTGTDGAGTALTETLTFTAADIPGGIGEMTTVGKFASVEADPDVENWRNNSLGNFFAYDSPVITAGVVAGTVKITGLDKGGLEFVDVRTFTRSTLETPQETDVFWDEITNIELAGFASGEATVTAQDQTVEAFYYPDDSRLRRFWDVEYSKGGIPNRYRGVIMPNIDVGIARDAALTANSTVMGRLAEKRTNIAGDTGPTAQPSDASKLGNASTKILTGWQTEIVIDEIALAMIGGSFSLNNNLSNSDIIALLRHQISAPFQNDKRMVMIDVEVPYDKDNDFSEIFQNNRTVNNVIMRMVSDAAASAREVTEFVIPTGKVMEEPDPADTGFTRITQSIMIEGNSPKIGKTPSDYYIRTVTSKFNQPKIFTT